MLQNQNETIKEIFHFINEEIQDIVENRSIKTASEKSSLICKSKEYLHHLLEINSLTMKEVLLYPLEELIKTIENSTSQDYYLYCKNSLKSDVWSVDKKIKLKAKTSKSDSEDSSNEKSIEQEPQFTYKDYIGIIYLEKEEPDREYFSYS